MKKVKIICYCGSLRVAMDAFKKVEYQSVIDGVIALLPCCMFVDIQREYGADSDYKIKADKNHKRKIDICDEVFVLNVGGYIGESTRSEINYATRIGKPVRYLEPTTDEAWQAWEEDQKTNPQSVNPHAFVYGYSIAKRKYNKQ